MTDIDTHLAQHGLRRHPLGTRTKAATVPKTPAPDRVLLAFDAAYPRAPIPHAWWLGNGYIEARNIHNRLTVEGLWVAENRRNQGHGAAMLDVLCGLADREGAITQMRVHAYSAREGLNNKQLRAWYKRWGFVDHPTREGWLWRLSPELRK